MDDKSVSLTLWDFGGTKQFRPFLDSYVLGANGAVLMFDLTNPDSLQKIDQWVSIIRKHDEEIPILFMGSKFDLKDQISVKDDRALALKEEYDFFKYIKTSSKTNHNVDEAFELLTRKILERIQGKK